MRPRSKRSEEGFTLTELIVTVLILGILAGVLVFAVTGVAGGGASSACQANVTTVNLAAETYFAERGMGAPTLAALADAGFLHRDTAIGGDNLVTSGYTITFTPSNPLTSGAGGVDPSACPATANGRLVAKGSQSPDFPPPPASGCPANGSPVAYCVPAGSADTLSLSPHLVEVGETITASLDGSTTGAESPWGSGQLGSDASVSIVPISGSPPGSFQARSAANPTLVPVRGCGPVDSTCTWRVVSGSDAGDTQATWLAIQVRVTGASGPIEAADYFGVVPERFRVSGVATGAAGSPLAGARVRLTRPSSTYVAGQGDTVAAIADRDDLTAAQILSANPELSANQLIDPGTAVHLPGASVLVTTSSSLGSPGTFAAFLRPGKWSAQVITPTVAPPSTFVVGEQDLPDVVVPTVETAESASTTTSPGTITASPPSMPTEGGEPTTSTSTPPPATTVTTSSNTTSTTPATPTTTTPTSTTVPTTTPTTTAPAPTTTAPAPTTTAPAPAPTTTAPTTTVPTVTTTPSPTTTEPGPPIQFPVPPPVEAPTTTLATSPSPTTPTIAPSPTTSATLPGGTTPTTQATPSTSPPDTSGSTTQITQPAGPDPQGTDPTPTTQPGAATTAQPTDTTPTTEVGSTTTEVGSTTTQAATTTSDGPSSPPPGAICAWELPDMSRGSGQFSYTDSNGDSSDDPLQQPTPVPCTLGTNSVSQLADAHDMVGFRPNTGDAPDTRQVQLWGEAAAGPGGEAVGDVSWQVFRPDGSLDQSANGVEQPTVACVGPPGMFDAAQRTGQLGETAIQDPSSGLIADCESGHANLYEATIGVSYHEPCGEYRVVLRVITGSGESDLVSFMNVDCYVQIQTNLAAISWPSVKSGETVDGLTGSGTTPTVAQLGNAPAALTVVFGPLVRTGPADSSEAGTTVLTTFGAGLGPDADHLALVDPVAAGAPATFADPGDLLQPDATNVLELYLHAGASPMPGNYSGSLAFLVSIVPPPASADQASDAPPDQPSLPDGSASSSTTSLAPPSTPTSTSAPP